MSSIEIPNGFAPHYRKSALTDPWEPLFSHRTEESVHIGLRAAAPHANGRGFVHGGLIMALADNAMGLSCGEKLRAKAPETTPSLVTVNLALDFVGSARIGQWLEFRPTVHKTGNRLCFASALIQADGVLCARANATFSVV